MTEPLTIRFAEGPTDLRWCVEHDGHLDEPVLQRKCDAQEVIVADVGGQLVGLLRLDYLWSTVPHVAQVRVLEHHRKEGIGRALMLFLEEQARAAGATIVLSSTRPDKIGAQQWHRKIGFTECGSLSGFGPNGEPVIFFLKKL